MKRFLGALVLTLCAACSDQTATQYVGAVMSEASPEREGTLSLTLFSRTDTSFSGIMEFGSPATGTGSAYAWHEGSELRIVTVAATGGDTILWNSKLTDDGLGGRYSVTGGARSGQGGTWRARLTKGPPASPATLRLPPPAPVPPTSATWPLIPLGLAVGWLARWILQTPKPAAAGATVAESGSAFGRWRPELSGISGWLAFFLIAQLLGLAITIAGFGSALTNYAESLGVGAAITGMQPLLVFELVVQVIAPLVSIVGMVLIVRRSPYAPRYWYGYLVLSAIVLVADLLLAGYMGSEMKRLLGAEYSEATANDGTGEMIRQTVVSIVWALYWVRSQRVRATFGAAALDRAASTTRVVPALAASAVPTVTTPSARRRWGRIGLRVGGVLLALVVVLVVVGALQARLRPYSVAQGVDIRKTVAGRWDWTTNKDRCADPHTIAFSEDGKVMTIVQSTTDIGVAETTTTYDIELVTQSTIRGAIRGEDRLTDDGKPVVWDLVLVGPDQYRWRRTDWSSPWSYTAKIDRCATSNVAGSPTR